MGVKEAKQIIDKFIKKHGMENGYKTWFNMVIEKNYHSIELGLPGEDLTQKNIWKLGDYLADGLIKTLNKKIKAGNTIELKSELIEDGCFNHSLIIKKVYEI